MKRIISFLLCIMLCAGHIVLAEENGEVVFDMDSFNAGVGETVAYSLRLYSNSGISDITDYQIECESEALSFDKKYGTITASEPGVYDITFNCEERNFTKTVKLAVNDTAAVLVKGEPVYTEDFEGELPECFSNTGAEIRQDDNGNGYMYIDGRQKVVNSRLFGGNLTDYVFEADIQALGCDAGSNSQISVGLRANEDLSAYRFANHDVVRYPGSGHTVGSGGTLRNAFSVSRSGSNVLLATWYYDFVRDGFEDMYDSASRAHVKPYRWQVSIIGDDIAARISDIETGASVAEFESKASDVDNSSAPLAKGGTTISLHSTAARYDNISIRPVAELTSLCLRADRDIVSGEEGDNSVKYAVKMLSQSGERDTLSGTYSIKCDGAQVDEENGVISFSLPGEYFAVAECCGKYAVEKILVSSDYELIENAGITIPEQVSEDFELVYPDGINVIYSSSNSRYIKIDGTKATVTCPDDQDENVVITAALVGEGVVVVKKFNVTVKRNIAEGTVFADTEKLCCNTGEIVPVNVRVIGNYGEINNASVSIKTDDKGLVVDETARTVTSDAEGIYTFLVSVPDYEFEKSLQIAFVNKSIPAVTNKQEVYSEAFDSEDYDETFKNGEGFAVSDGRLNIQGIGRSFQTPAFGPRDSSGNLIPLEEYTFDADMNMLSCDAGSTGQMSVGVRYSEDEDASYRMSHHERIKYDAQEGAVNTQNAQIGVRVLSLGYGKSFGAASWYIPKINYSPSVMFSGRGYSKEYHWSLTVTKNALVGKITDKESGAVVERISCTLDELNNKANGAKLNPLGAGGTVLGAWSTNFTVDNIKISTISAFDSLEIELEKNVIDTPNTPIAIKVYSVSGESRTELSADEVKISCDDLALAIENGSVIPSREGEFIIRAEKDSKAALARLVVSAEQSDVIKQLETLSFGIDMNAVKEDFPLPTAENTDIRFISSDAGALRIDGNTAMVTRPDVGENDRSVTLTAIVTSGEATQIKDFVLKICAKITDRQAVDAAKAAIKLPEKTASDITLPIKYDDGVSIEWKSSDSGVIKADGRVSRAADDRRAALTAIISRNGVKESVVFSVTVEGTGSGTSSSGGSSGSGGGKTTPVIEAVLPAAGSDEVFSDLQNYDWAKNSILELYERGIVSGYGDGSFMPGKAVTREEFVSMIARSLGMGQNGERCFSDVDSDSWYAGYVAAASHAGIVSGMPDGSFGVGKSIIRQDMAVMTAAAMGYGAKESEPFKDHEQISEYAKNAVYSLKEAGIVEGNEGYFYPFNNLTRAEAAVVIAKILN